MIENGNFKSNDCKSLIFLIVIPGDTNAFTLLLKTLMIFSHTLNKEN